MLNLQLNVFRNISTFGFQIRRQTAGPDLPRLFNESILKKTLLRLQLHISLHRFEFQIRTHTADLDFSWPFQNTYPKNTVLNLWLNIFQCMFALSSSCEAALSSQTVQGPSDIILAKTVFQLRLDTFRYEFMFMSRFDKDLIPEWIDI